MIRRNKGLSAWLFACLFSVSCTLFAAEESAPNQRPVKAVAEARLNVRAGAEIPVYLSADWSKPLPEIERAVIVLHGRLRNADVYYRSGLTARDAASAAGKIASQTLIIAPQFLAQADIDAWHLSDKTLRWTWEGWEGGDAATTPVAASSFEALDAILAHLADRALFPTWRQVVVAGHSGGGQVVQRYAIATHGEAALLHAGIAVRYVVANPSSYAWFSAERPEPGIAAACPGFNNWKYGMEARPEYLASQTPAALERAYVARRVIYLLGTNDTNPQHPALDRSCMAEAQGPYRLARGRAYVAAMQARDAGTPNHSLWEVNGVGHDGDAMFSSPCGLAALFDLPGCPAKRP